MMKFETAIATYVYDFLHDERDYVLCWIIVKCNLYAQQI